MATIWIAIQAVVDTLIFIALLFYFLERKKRIKEEEKAELRKEELKELIGSLDQLIMESERSSMNLSDKVLASQKEIRELLAKAERKQEELKNLGEKAESVLEKIIKQLETIPDNNKHIFSSRHKYLKASQLAKTGLNAEEISRKLDLPIGEVELILELPMRNSKEN